MLGHGFNRHNADLKLNGSRRKGFLMRKVIELEGDVLSLWLDCDNEEAELTGWTKAMCDWWTCRIV